MASRIGKTEQSVNPERSLRQAASRVYPGRASLLNPKAESHDALIETIEKAIRPQLAFRDGASAYHDHNSLLDDYGKSADTIRRLTEEAQVFVRSIRGVSVTYETIGAAIPRIRDAVLNDYYGETLKKATAPLIQPRAVLSAELEEMPVELAEVKLRDDLNRAVRRFARGVVESLDCLQEVELIGRVEWPVATACDAFVYQDTVIREQPSEQVTAGRAERVERGGANEGAVIRQEFRRVRKERHVVRHGLRLFYLSNATSNRVRGYHGFIPAEIQRFIDTVPPWLRESIRIVDGKRRTDILFARDVYVDEREETEIWQEEREEAEYCPLVTLGDRVLAAWGEKEGNVAAARHWYGTLLLLAVVLLFLAGGLIGLGQLLHSAFGYLAILVGPLSVATFVEGLRERGIGRQIPVGLAWLVLAGVGWTLLCVGLLGLVVGVASLEWIPMGAGLLGLVLGGSFLQRVWDRLN